MYGRCEPGGGGVADHIIATVVKAHNGDGLLATITEADKTLQTSTDSCAMLRRTLIEELVPASSNSEGKSLPHVVALSY